MKVTESSNKACQRCGEQVQREKLGTISFKGSNYQFCERCFKSVFKYDPSMKTVEQIWRDNGKSVPFVVRSNNWHRSSYMLIREAKVANAQKNGKPKVVYVGDFFLRGDLKEQNHVVGKANHFIWFPWSSELAQKFKEPVSESPEPMEVIQQVQ